MRFDAALHLGRRARLQWTTDVPSAHGSAPTDSGHRSGTWTATLRHRVTDVIETPCSPQTLKSSKPPRYATRSHSNCRAEPLTKVDAYPSRETPVYFLMNRFAHLLQDAVPFRVMLR